MLRERMSFAENHVRRQARQWVKFDVVGNLEIIGQGDVDLQAAQPLKKFFLIALDKPDPRRWIRYCERMGQFGG